MYLHTRAQAPSPIVFPIDAETRFDDSDDYLDQLQEEAEQEFVLSSQPKKGLRISEGW